MRKLKAMNSFLASLKELEVYLMPAYVLLILVEALSTLRRQSRLYEWRDFTLALGIFAVYFIYLTFFAAYLWQGLYWVQKHSFYHLPNSFLSFLTCFVLVDFIYYASHIPMHRVRLFWAFHNVHHSGHKFHLLLHFRTNVLQEIPFFLMSLPLLLVGFSTKIFFYCILLNLTYQFSSHISSVPKWGILNKFLITPHLHSFHHGVDTDQYNYGALFNFWDKMFGTFKDEPSAPKSYGLKEGFLGYNPFKVFLWGFLPKKRIENRPKSSARNLQDR